MKNWELERGFPLRPLPETIPTGARKVQAFGSKGGWPESGGTPASPSGNRGHWMLGEGLGVAPVSAPEQRGTDEGRGTGTARRGSWLLARHRWGARPGSRLVSGEPAGRPRFARLAVAAAPPVSRPLPSKLVAHPCSRSAPPHGTPARTPQAPPRPSPSLHLFYRRRTARAFPLRRAPRALTPRPAASLAPTAVNDGAGTYPTRGERRGGGGVRAAGAAPPARRAPGRGSPWGAGPRTPDAAEPAALGAPRGRRRGGAPGLRLP